MIMIIMIMIIMMIIIKIMIMILMIVTTTVTRARTEGHRRGGPQRDRQLAPRVARAGSARLSGQIEIELER